MNRDPFPREFSADTDGPDVLIAAVRPEVRALFTESFSRHGCRTAEVQSGREALARVAEAPPDLMLIELDLPDLNGADVLAGALASDPNLGVVMLLDEEGGERGAECVRRGALDYLTAPFDGAAADRDSARALRWWTGLAREHWLLRLANEEVMRRTDEVADALERQERFTVATLDALINVQEAKNPFLAGHSLRVASVSAAVAAQVGLPAFEVEKVRRAGRLHDIGMIGVRERAWDKPGHLTDREYEEVKQHTVIGARILEPLTYLGPVVDYVHSHHERWDGSGYPDGLVEHEIPLGGRIIHAAEVYDALTQRRPYQETMSAEAALARMSKLAERALDPTVVAAFAETVSERHRLGLGRDDVVRKESEATRRPRRPA